VKADKHEGQNTTQETVTVAIGGWNGNILSHLQMQSRHIRDIDALDTNLMPRSTRILPMLSYLPRLQSARNRHYSTGRYVSRATPDVLQRRTLFTQKGINNKALNALESSANKNLGDDNLQSRFMQALLHYNFPEVVVKRFEAGGFAVNETAESAYITALQRLNRVKEAEEFRRRSSFSQTPTQQSESTISETPRPTYTQSLQNPIRVTIEECKI
jgi:hypothetical protein